ncbi:MAG: heme exporter protein CcmB [Alphaproteobacteria bacterium]|nr:heme exporter protein CcmB [Alphaproteobacteria bacterium]TAD87848.1 MAG: heme exporter protein CcmB [Alphaproteobacteria bacterium]
MQATLAVLRRDLALGLRQAADLVTAVGFFAVAALLFPFGVGPEPQILARIAAGVVWVTALLAGLLSLDRMFQPDAVDGSLDQLALSPAGLAGVAVAKAAAHWITTGLPLVLVSPVLAIMLNLDPAAITTLMVSMLIGTPCLSLFGAIGAALTLGARRGAALVPLLILPLVVPVLIFGVAAVEATATGLGARPHLMILAALLAAALPLAPLAAAAGLKLSLD